MANTSCQIECEDWVRREWMKQTFGESFFRERVRLTSGGVFDFDAVNADGSIVGTISTSSARTISGKWATGAVMKLRSDMLFLVLAAPKRTLLILTEKDMFELCKKEAASGRTPQQVEFFHAPLPNDLAGRLVDAKRRGSEEARGIEGASSGA
jgi:hypothetical protein